MDVEIRKGMYEIGMLLEGEENKSIDEWLKISRIMLDRLEMDYKNKEITGTTLRMMNYVAYDSVTNSLMRMLGDDISGGMGKDAWLGEYRGGES